MARPLPSVPLSPMTGGIERREAKAKGHQAAEGENVYETNGEIRRRDAIVALAAGPVFMYPAEQCVVMDFDYSTDTFTTHAERRPSVTTAFSSTRLLLIGCTSKFDGIDWAHVAESATLAASWRHAKISRVAGWTPSASYGGHTSDFAALPWVLDSTKRRYDGRVSSLQRTGRIAWHSSEMVDWEPVSINSLSLYWVALELTAEPQDPDNTPTRAPAAVADAITIERPGIRVFRHGKVTGLVPVRGKGDAFLLVMSERTGQDSGGGKSATTRGQEKGGQIGAVRSEFTKTEELGIVEDEGSGTAGEVAGPSWNTTPPGGASANGSSGVITKNDESYSWLTESGTYEGQWAGQPIHSDLTPSAGSASGVTFATQLNPENSLEDCVIECTQRVTGPLVGEKRRIVTHAVGGSTTLAVHPAWSATPNANNRFRILGSPFFARIIEPHVDANSSAKAIETFEVDSSGEHILNTSPAEAYGDRRRLADTSLDSKNINFELVREARFEMQGNAQWSACWDTISREHLLASGVCGPVRWDGRSLRRLEALADPDSAMVQMWTGVLRDMAPEQNTPDLTPGSFLRSEPPAGRFIVDYSGRLVIAGVSADPNRIYWSAPGGANNLWPRVYEALIRANSNQPIAGMRVFGGELVVWTPSQVFSSGPPDNEGMFYFAPKSSGVGFSNHAGVGELSYRGQPVLIGPNPDGVYAYAGTELVAVLDDWSALLPGGVNKAGLDRCVAAVSKYDTIYALAVPSAGSNVNDRILVFDYVDRTWWVWTAPFGGVTSMAVDRDSAGRERILFGTWDGFVCELAGRETDDGRAITGRARSVPARPAAHTHAFTGLLIAAGETGASDLTIKTFVNQKPSAQQTWIGEFDAGTGRLGTGLYGTATAGTRTYKTRKIALPAATRGESLQYEVSGTGRWALRSAELLLRPVGQRSK